MLNIGPAFFLAALGFDLASAEPLLWNSRSASASKSHEARTLDHDGSLTDGQWEIVQKEYEAAVQVARVVKHKVTDSNIDTFVGDQTEEWVESYKKDYLGGFIHVGDDVDTVWMFRYGDDKDKECNELAERGKHRLVSMAHTEGHTTTLCKNFFHFLPSTASLIDEGLDKKEYTLDNYETRAFILLHEYLHLKTKVPGTPFKHVGEYWGSHDCAQLVLDDEKEARKNAENWMLVASSIYWNEKTKRDIPLTFHSESSSSNSGNSGSSSDHSDSGSQSGDKCKRGDDPASPACIAEFEYPKLLPSGSGGFKPTGTGGISPSNTGSSSAANSAKPKRVF